jgi:multiple sugar transport system permease protein
VSDVALGRMPRVSEAASTRSFSGRGLVRRAAVYLVLVIGAIFAAFPFVWMVLTSLKSHNESLADPPTFLPSLWHWSNYVQAWQAAPFTRYFLNTFFICACVVALGLVTSTLAAYAFARLDFWGRDVLFLLFLATLMIPFETIIIPNFLILKHLHWLNTFNALIVPFGASVFSVFLLRQHFHSLPQELFDSAALDGAGHLRMLWNVAIPLSRGPLAAITLFAFLGSWNSLLWPLIVTNSQNLRPVQLGLSVFTTEAGTQPQLLMAANAFTIAPIVILYFFAQKQFMEGLAATGIKG